MKNPFTIVDGKLYIRSPDADFYGCELVGCEIVVSKNKADIRPAKMLTRMEVMAQLAGTEEVQDAARAKKRRLRGGETAAEPAGE